MNWIRLSKLDPRAVWISAIVGAIFVFAVVANRAAFFDKEMEHDTPTALAYSFADVEPAALLQTIDRRCVVCHGCYDAPCQFRMTSAEGIARGASKQPVYDASRLIEAPLTRLGIDASTVGGWRNLGFFDVTQNMKDDNSARSLLWRMLEYGKNHPVLENAALPKSIDLDITRELTCPTPAEFDRYKRDNPYGGMPYAMAPLSEEESASLLAWVGAGAPALQRSQSMTESLAHQISEWETFLNGRTNKERLIARYLYEHLFLAHLYFSDDSTGAYFKLVRASTPPGQPVDIIATRRPFDDPVTNTLYYRFILITQPILHKTHITYELDPAKLEHLKNIFLNTEWDIETLPSYERSVASNPFAAFAAIPAQARYEFLLDDAEYFIRTFIRGPVCRGQVAVNVIEDRFWVMFLAPNVDFAVRDPVYLGKATPLLGLPAEYAEGSLFERFVPAYLDHHRLYAELRERRYGAADPDKAGPSLDGIWRGNANTGPALLTVFRHFDNATVVAGFVGDIPETAWVIDFPTLERIYYNLVAGFDVFGSVDHQVATRVYMDLLRIESEDLFLTFLPPTHRRAYHDDWYRGGHTKVRTLYHRKPIDVDRGTQIIYTSDDPKAEFLTKVLERDRSGVSKADALSRPYGPQSTLTIQHSALSSLASTPAPWVKYLPDLILLRIKNTKGEDGVFSIIHNKAHTNIAFLFAENLRREPKKDTVTIIEGQIGSYPNYFLIVDRPHLSNLVEDLQSVRSKKEWLSFIDTYGVRRSSPDFWRTADFFQNVATRDHPRVGGLLDLNRYVDP